MKTYFFFGEPKIENTTICLGDFDGIHKGHRQIFKKAKEQGEWGVFLFNTNSKGEPSVLTLNEKISIIRELGAKYVISADFEQEIRTKSPKEFIDVLADMKISGVSVGYDYRFGYNAVGDTMLLEKLCTKNNINTFVVDAVKDSNLPIKSTKIRELIKNGEMEEATRLLESPYLILGTVVKGFENGRKMGFPTANIAVPAEKLLPPDGVYKGLVNGKRSIINIGKNPTFNAKNRTVEAHIIGFDGNLYGESITVELLKKVRDEIKFDSVNELKNQIKSDIKNVMEGNENG